MEIPVQPDKFYSNWDSSCNPVFIAGIIFKQTISRHIDERFYSDKVIDFLNKEAECIEQNSLAKYSDYYTAEEKKVFLIKKQLQKADEENSIQGYFIDSDANSSRLFKYKQSVIKQENEDTDKNHLTWYYPSSESPPIDEFKDFVVPENKEQARVSVLLQSGGGGFMIKKIGFDAPKIDNLELNYGSGFNKANDKILDRLNNNSKGIVILRGVPGSGKCLGKNTPVLMFNGSIKMSQNIKNGDMVMGPDSTSRIVSGVNTGKEELYKIIPIKGDSFIVNKSHILSLKYSGHHKHQKGELINKSVKEILDEKLSYRELPKLWRTAINFPFKSVPLDPYFLGVWLGDGTSAAASVTSMDKEIVSFLKRFAKGIGHDIILNKGARKGLANTWNLCGKRGRKIGGEYPYNYVKRLLKNIGVLNNKHIPDIYKFNDRETRLKLLAGLIDTDGHLANGIFEITLKNKRLLQDLCFLCRSLGFSAYPKKTKKYCVYKGQKRWGIYWRMNICGNLDEIPTKIKRKKANPRKQIKNVLVTGFKIKSIGFGNYYGFNVDKDGLFCLGDFTVTHNSTYIKYLTTQVKRQFIFVPINLCGSLSEPSFLTLLLSQGKDTVLVLEDAEQAIQSRDNNLANASVVSSLLNLADGILGNLLRVSFILTWNTEKENVDKALTRPGRTLYSHNFGKLSIIDSQKLANILGKKFQVKEEMSLAEIYNIEIDTNYEDDKPKIMGFGAIKK